MYGMGQTRSSGAVRHTSAYPSAAEFDGSSRDVSVVPILLQKSAIGGARRLKRFLKPSVATHSIGSGGFWVVWLGPPSLWRGKHPARGGGRRGGWGGPLGACARSREGG